MNTQSTFSLYNLSTGEVHTTYPARTRLSAIALDCSLLPRGQWALTAPGWEGHIRMGSLHWGKFAPSFNFSKSDPLPEDCIAMMQNLLLVT